MAPAFISSCWRRSVERARSSAVTARWRSARACPTAAVPASTAAASSPRVRGSSSGDSAGVMRASTVLPRTTLSPGSISMRCTRPDTGAVTRNLSRTRVSPSSSTVTCIGPRSARTTATSIDCGHRATATIAATTSTEAISFLFFRKRMPSPVPFESTESTERTDHRGGAEKRQTRNGASAPQSFSVLSAVIRVAPTPPLPRKSFPYLQHRDQIECIELSSDDQPRHQRCADDSEE